MRGRMRKEIAMLESDPPFGVSAWPKDDKIDQLEAQILGPDGSPYEKGVFQLEIEIPERYPFEPPKVRFLTPIYHPNIDDGGRICLDTLKMQPKGSWLPSVNISTLLTTIRLLMAEPNADDGLMPDIADVFKHNRELFNQKATEMTAQHARGTEAHAVKATHETKLEPDDGPCSHEEKEEDCADPPTQETEGPSQHEESVSSDDSFSDGNSSSENENGSTSDFDKNDEEKPPSKRRRQE
ncbi:Ubiquitin-conjugating enzyme E2 T [Phytophthora boehmeriae]|uniref:E2 ubiquitin-conjugating enzyme n=1 Tax=Phytophthora boehmeriae TaxID=109152 RepID=A0A8T1W1T3_9STRA|nr:Ubiquitin-conjugating enzyme E2 T [Phytophthora boehmeriae]